MGFTGRTHVDRLAEARLVALKAHGDQKYGQDLPYIHHLDHTLTVLERFRVADEEILYAGLLHDTIEDTTMSEGLLGALTTPRVAKLVDACTDGEGKNRRERKARPLKLIPEVPGAVLVKLADRIANVESCWATGNDGLLEMYAKEYVDLHVALYTAGDRRFGASEIDAERMMWRYLGQLLARA